MQKYKTLLPVYLKGLVAGKYTLRQAAESTGYSVPWLCRLKKQYELSGLSILDHKNKNKVPINKLPESLRQKIVAIYVNQYQDVNFAYFNKCLKEYHDISISHVTLHSILKSYGIQSPEARHVKKNKKVHRPRLRRSNEGDMIQIDGTPFSWFYKFGDEKKYCLVGSIDDATSKITGLYLTQFECLYGYLEILRQTCVSYGAPREVYSDRAAIFCVTPKSKKKKAIDKWEELAVLHDERTQWQRVLSELNIRQILAWSPEAKGRVERMWRTIQGQLPQWFKLHNCSTVDQANKILPSYIAEFNESYSVEALSPDPFWLPVTVNLPDVLCAKISRRTDHSGAFSFHSYKFLLDCTGNSYRNFTLCISEKGIFGYLDGQYYPVKCMEPVLGGLGETMPQVVQDIIYRYLFAFGKEISA